MNGPSGKLVSFAGTCPACMNINFYYLDMPDPRLRPNRFISIDPKTMKIPELYSKPKYCKNCNYLYKKVVPSLVEYERATSTI